MLASTLRLRLDNPRWTITALAYWIPIAAALSVLAFIVYAAVQQDIRQSANEPQVGLAEAAAAELSAGKAPSAVLLDRSADMRSSLAPFVIVYDARGDVLASSVSLDGQTPDLPPTVFDALRRSSSDRSLPGYVLGTARTAVGLLHGEKPCCTPGAVRHAGEVRFTWEPAQGVRAATVLASYGGASSGYVLAGRSLREVELLEDDVLAVVALGLAGGLFVTLLATVGVTAIATILRSQGD